MADRSKLKLLVILGPTASGKSDLAVHLARKLNGEVISADSRQVYKGLDIGTGKVHGAWSMKHGAWMHRGIPHHLIDVASPTRTFTVAHYQKLARRALKDIVRHGKLPIVCGGTGLYADALLYDYSLPEVKPNPQLRKKLEALGAAKMFAILEKLDPARAKTIDPQNPRRLVRALEIVLQTGKPVPPLPGRHSDILENVGMSSTDVLKIGIRLPKTELERRINARIRTWFRQGLLQEIQTLRKSGLSFKRLHELGLEYRYPALFLQKKISREEMIRKMETETRRYAKRQMTWFKRDPEIRWIKESKAAEKLIEKVV